MLINEINIKIGSKEYFLKHSELKGEVFQNILAGFSSEHISCLCQNNDNDHLPLALCRGHSLYYLRSMPNTSHRHLPECFFGLSNSMVYSYLEDLSQHLSRDTIDSISQLLPAPPKSILEPHYAKNLVSLFRSEVESFLVYDSVKRVEYDSDCFLRLESCSKFDIRINNPPKKELFPAKSFPYFPILSDLPVFFVGLVERSEQVLVSNKYLLV